MNRHPLIRNAGIGSLLALILVGCGGGSDESTPAVTSSAISGVVSKGPLNGANVCAYAIAGGAKGSLVGTCQTTDANGNYTLDLGAYTGDVLFEASGGSYVDEATGVTVNLASPLRGMLTGVTGGQATAAITALTELAYQMANASVGNLTATNIQNAVVRVQNNFGVTDIVTTLPVDALSVPAQATATQKSYALALATVSQYLKGQPSGTSLTNALQTMQACLSASTSCATLGIELNTAMSTFQTAHTAFSGLTTPIASFGSAAGSSALTSGSGAELGAAPVGLTPTTVSSNQVSLTWTAAANSNYNIYRSMTPSFTISGGNLVGSYSGSSIILGVLGQGPFVDKHLTPATTYYYKITAVPLGTEGDIVQVFSADSSASKPDAVSVFGLDCSMPVWEQAFAPVDVSVGAGVRYRYHSHFKSIHDTFVSLPLSVTFSKQVFAGLVPYATLGFGPIGYVTGDKYGKYNAIEAGVNYQFAEN